MKNIKHDYSLESLSILDSVIKLEPHLNYVDDSQEIYYRNLLLDKLCSHGFEGFLHTTEFNNFLHIMNDGVLKSRTRTIHDHDKFIDKASTDVINHTENRIKNFVRFYYFPKTPTNFAAHYEKPVMLIFDRRIIFDQSAVFINQSASNNSRHETRFAKEALEFNWDIISERGNYLESKFFDGSNSSEITKHRNAEFMILNEINIDYIKEIKFKNYNDYNNACNFVYPNIKFTLDPNVFC